MIKIELNRVNDAYLMEATNALGKSFRMDGATDIGGSDSAMRPMQVLLAALGGCSSIDVISILKKQRQDLKDIKITMTGEREPNVEPSLYTDVNVHFKLYGNLDADKVEKAISLSMDKYCSVAKTMEKTAKITHSFEIINS